MSDDRFLVGTARPCTANDRHEPAISPWNFSADRTCSPFSRKMPRSTPSLKLRDALLAFKAGLLWLNHTPWIIVAAIR